MRVYVWKAYGHITVYAAETSDDLERLFNTVVGCLGTWGVDESIEAETHIFNKGKEQGRRDKMMQAINNLTSIGDSHESFEYNGFTHVEQA